MKPKVIVVDDETNIGTSLAAIFMNRGYESKTAFSAELAVEIIAGWEPNLAIVDVRLPKMNGIDLAIALKNGHPSCRVLLFSGQRAPTIYSRRRKQTVICLRLSLSRRTRPLC
jgi:DNA-binding NtrC family response regulator